MNYRSITELPRRMGEIEQTMITMLKAAVEVERAHNEDDEGLISMLYDAAVQGMRWQKNHHVEMRRHAR